MEEERITAEKVEKTEKKVKIDIDRYRAKEGEKISLKKFSTTVSMSFLLSSRRQKKKITITCGVSIRRCPAGEISVFSIVPIMKMWWLPVSMI